METTAPPVKSDAVEGAVTTVEMADVYRSLVASLRDKLGGTIDDANAEAIARAAAQVYREEVEPRLWEEKSAHELLDGLGVPRSGAFVPYSLRDRLLLLRRRGADDPYRAKAQELLDDLGVPRVDGEGREYSLRVRLTRLLGSLDGISGGDGAPGAVAAVKPAEGGEPDQHAGDGPGDGAQPGPDLVDALETIHRAVGPGDDDADPADPADPPPPPAAPTSELIGLGTFLGTIQEELLEVRQAIESLREEVRDAVALFQGGAGTGGAAPVVPVVPLTEGGPEILVRRVDDGPDPATETPTPEGEAGASEPRAGPPEAAAPTAGPDFVPPGSGSPNGEGGEAGPPSDPVLATPDPGEAAESEGAPDPPAAGPADPHAPTRVLPAVPVVADGPQLADEPGAEEPAAPRRRSRRFVVLLLLVLLIGALLAAGITAAIVLGWDELESRFLETVTAPAWSGGAAAP